MHEPDVQCISKGKAHKRYEFGQKVAVATTNRSNWIVASRWCPGNPYDGHTLSETLTAVERVTGVAPTDAYVDKGNRGYDYAGKAEVHIAGQRKKNTTRAERKRRRRRSAIGHTVTLSSKIGHLRSDHRMGRCFLAMLAGDAINAVLAAAGSNLRKLLRLLRRGRRRLFFALCDFVFSRCNRAAWMALTLIHRLHSLTTGTRSHRPPHSTTAKNGFFRDDSLTTTTIGGR